MYMTIFEILSALLIRVLDDLLSQHYFIERIVRHFSL